MRFIVGCIVFVGIMLLGWSVLGIRPSLSEAILVIIACAVSDATEEAMK